MNILQNKYFIIRVGDFATNGNKKLFYCLFSICLCIEEYINKGIIDCFKIMIGSTIVWTIIEYLLNITKTRVIKPMYITYMNGEKKLLNKYFGIFLQGFQEGGVVTTFGLYFGDRLFNYKYLVLFHIFIFYIIINLLTKQNTNNENLSKRQINTISSLILMSSITLYNIKKIYENPLHLQRQLQMLFAMIYVCSIWTFIAYYKGFRKVAIYNKDNHKKKSNYKDSLLILGYDVIFEIGIAYITFYNWFLL